MLRSMMDKRLRERAVHRAKIIRGQVDGLIRALEGDVYCTELLAQSRSIQRSLKSLDAYVLENHLRTHVKEGMKSKEGIEQAVKELIKVYTLSNK